MKMKSLFVAALIIVTLVTLVYLYEKGRDATLILYNGIVYTVDASQSVAEAVAIHDNTIVGVGTTHEMQSGFAAAKMIDLKGKAVYPGFTDAHAHLEGLGAMLVNLNLTGTTSVQEIQRLVAERASTLPDGAWLRGRAWDQNDWDVKEFPTHQMLDEVAGSHPVYLSRIDGHAVWVNQKALDLARISKATTDPEGGRIVRDKEGNPTGIFIDNAIELVQAAMPPPSVRERTEAIEKGVHECLRVGLTEVHDMGVDLEMIGIYKTLIESKNFPFRVYVAIDGPGKTWNQYLSRGPEKTGYEGRLTVRALKLYVDGALGSRGAALIEPYTDDRANRGLTLTVTDTLRKAALDALQRGFQVCTHAIGDRGNHVALDVYEEVLKSEASKAQDARFRIEHAQVVDGADVPRFKKLGILPSMQPTHCTSDMYWAEERVGAKRIKGAYAWRSFLEAGSIIPGGSDFPVESPNPLFGFYAAITRQDNTGWPSGGWYSDQCMTREEALKAFTLWAAYAAFEEDKRGSIEKGKLADLVILSNDIMKCEPKQILETKVEYTIVNGEIVYASNKEHMSRR